MVVRFLQLDCILKAIKKYVLNDLMPVCPAEVCKLVTKKIPDIRHHVIKYAYSAGGRAGGHSQGQRRGGTRPASRLA